MKDLAPEIERHDISSYILSCLSEFEKLSSELSKTSFDYRQQIQISDINDERGRLRIWSGNTGAHLIGCDSLAYRLRDASQLQHRVVGLLEELKEKLQKGEYLQILTLG